MYRSFLQCWGREDWHVHYTLFPAAKDERRKEFRYLWICAWDALQTQLHGSDRGEANTKIFSLCDIELSIIIQPQYVFIHDALLEAIECGVTEVQARELREQYKQLCEVDVEQKVTSLNLQFDNLDRTIHRKLRRNTGTLQVNKPKNRYGANPDALPCMFEASIFLKLLPCVVCRRS